MDKEYCSKVLFSIIFWSCLCFMAVPTVVGYFPNEIGMDTLAFRGFNFMEVSPFGWICTFSLLVGLVAARVKIGYKTRSRIAIICLVLAMVGYVYGSFAAEQFLQDVHAENIENGVRTVLNML
ncbi:hypothetical protein [Phascolarctobacterium sp.]|uniref:hypothetical protein n=2 Tax=Phascolarctobacterium sp. TaxID=2049039 RepID=UPI0038648C5F